MMDKHIINNPVFNSDYLNDNKPSSDWADSYPLGDGRIGAMVRGNPCADIISLNHDLLWRNYLSEPIYNTRQDMAEIKQLCLDNRWGEAGIVLEKTLPSRGAVYINPFVPAWDLYINMQIPEDHITNYHRWLDMKYGIAYTGFSADGVQYDRFHFCSSESKLFVTYIRSSIPGMLTGCVSLSRIGDPECTVTGGVTYGDLYCEGEFEEGVRFAGVAKVEHRNGRLTLGKRQYGLENDAVAKKTFGNTCTFDRDEMIDPDRGASLWFDHCDELWIYSSVCVDYESENPLQLCHEQINCKADFDTLYEKHCERFSEYYNRTKIGFTKGDEDDWQLTTPQLLERDRKKSELSPALCEVACNMSRYIAISSGMPRINCKEIKAPINLQGIWNRDTHPVWESDYHPDLNLHMCYWPLPLMGLNEWMEPLLCWMERLLPQAKIRAKDLYDCRGAVYTGCNDYKVLGGLDTLCGGSLGITAWFIQVLWMYYEHSPSMDLLKRIYLLMREVDLFYRDIFCSNDKGMLTFPFGSSPEMSFHIGDRIQFLSSPSTFDLTVVKEFYSIFQKAAETMGEDDITEEAATIFNKIEPPTILEDGSLCEWKVSHDEFEVGHRHRSPFVAFCPGSLYSVETDEEMTKAMSKLLDKRLSNGNKSATAFSFPLDAQIFARLREGNKAYDKLKKLLNVYALDNLMLTFDDWERKSDGAAWFPGIKVIQVEAELGMFAAFIEMIYQDTQGIIRLLPALPDNLDTGYVYGIRGRNKVICNLNWEKKELKEFKITILNEGKYKIKPPTDHFYLESEKGEIVQSEWQHEIFEFTGHPHETYVYRSK